jgi:hypothetical protein
MSNDKDSNYQEYHPLEFLILSCHEQCNQEDNDYDEFFNELVEIRRIINEPMDDLRQRFMQICCRFFENNRPPIQEILDWFTYLLFFPKEDGLLSKMRKILNILIVSHLIFHSHYFLRQFITTTIRRSGITKKKFFSPLLKLMMWNSLTWEML